MEQVQWKNEPITLLIRVECDLMERMGITGRHVLSSGMRRGLTVEFSEIKQIYRLEEWLSWCLVASYNR